MQATVVLNPRSDKTKPTVDMGKVSGSQASNDFEKQAFSDGH
jgi:hypothetical protein